MAFVRGCLLVLVIVVGMVAASLGTDGMPWRETVRWAEQQQPVLRRYLVPCPVLQPPADAAGVAGAGSYAAAAQAVPATAGELWELLRGACEGKVVPAAALDAALVQLAPAVAALRTAARDPDPALAAEFDESALLLVADALLVQAGRAAAVADLLDVFAAGADLANAWLPLQQMVGNVMLQRAVEAVDDRWLARLDAADRTRLAAALAEVDAVVRPESMLPLLAVRGLAVELDAEREVAPDSLGMANRWQAWRHGFSVRDSGRARLRAVVAAMQRFQADAVRVDGWSARRQLLAGLEAADRAANADLWRPFLYGIQANEEVRRTALAHLRLLRLALAWHAGAPLPRCEDPLGDGALQVVATATGVELRSAQPGLLRRCRPL